MKHKNIIKILPVIILSFFLEGCINPFAVYTLNNSAKKYIENNDIDGAIGRLESSLELNYSNYETRFLLTKLYFHQDKCEQALEHILYISDTNKKEPLLFWYKAEIYSCIAKHIYNKELTVANKVDEKVRDIIPNKKIIEKYKFNLKKANDAYDIYYNLAPTVEDRDEILNKIKKNKEKINYVYKKSNIGIYNDN